LPIRCCAGLQDSGPREHRCARWLSEVLRRIIAEKAQGRFSVARRKPHFGGCNFLF
jgi:hypothetical protein